MERTDRTIPELNDGKTCANCRHLYRRTVSIDAVVVECRLNPPVPVATIIQTPNGAQWAANGFYPQVSPPTDYWCASGFTPRLHG